MPTLMNRKFLLAATAVVMLASGPAQLAAPLAAHAATDAMTARQAPAATSVASTAYGWGANQHGQLGIGATSTTVTPAPTAVSLPVGVTAAAVAGGANFGLTLGSDGSIYSYGANNLGQLGTGSAGQPSSTPVMVALPNGVSALAIAAGAATGYALGSDGHLYAWGDNSYGQLGNGQLGNGQPGGSSPRPVRVSLPGSVSPWAVAAGSSSGYAITSGGVYAWGRGELGQLGNGTHSGSALPVSVTLPGGASATDIAAGHASAYVIGSNGKVYAWGDNKNAQLGATGTGPYSKVPVTVSFPQWTTPVAISGGYDAAYAIGANGILYAWGANSHRQLGNGTAGNSQTPVKVALPSGMTPVAVAGGRQSAYAVDAAGSLYAWGGNSDGQLGNGSVSYSSGPVAAALPTGTTSVVVGAEPTSLSGYALTGSGPAGDDERKTAQLRLTVGGPGPTVKIVGGGGGADHSNCTTDETNTSFTAAADPNLATIAFVAKSSGSCALEPSYSYFEVTVTGQTASGKPVVAFARVFFGQGGAGASYAAYCDTPLIHMTCQETSDRELTLVASPS